MPKPARGGTAIEALVGPVKVLNPLFESVDSERDVDSVIYQGLTTVDAQQNVVGLLASGWAVSPDHLTYTVDIRDGVRWADGQPFTADDVLFTYRVLQDLEYDQPGAEFWRDIGVAGAGPNRVVFSLRAPSAAFPLALRIGIIAKHLFAGMAPAQIMASASSGVRAIGTGPFKVAALSPLAISLDRNTFADPQPYLDHLVLRTYSAADPQTAIRAVLSGAADLVGDLEPQEVDALQGRSDVSVLESRLFTNSFVSLNADGAGKPFFSDPTVRVALAQAVDRKGLVDRVLAGRADADPNPIPTTSWAFSSVAAAAHPYDQLVAAKALDAAGWTQAAGATLRAKGGVPFKVGLVVADSYPNRQMGDALAAQLLPLGIEINVTPVPPSQLVQNYLVGRNYQMALVAFDVGPDPDQYTLWHSDTNPGALNFAYAHGWGLIDQSLEDGRNAVDPQARLAAYLQFQALMADAAPAIFLYSGRYDYAVSQRVHGVRVNSALEPTDRFQYVTEWYVNTGG